MIRFKKHLAMFLFCICFMAGCATPQKNAPTANTERVRAPLSVADSKESDIKIEVLSSPKTSDLQYRFVVSADSRGSETGVHEKQMRSVLSCIKKLDPQPSFMVVIGDLIQGAKTKKELAAQYDVWKRVAGEFYPIGFYYPAVGNHEMTLRDQGGLDAFNAAFEDAFQAEFYGNGYGKSVYYFDMGSARFFILNDYHPKHRHKIAPDVVRWMKEHTDKDKAFHFVFCHEPGWPTGAHLGSSLDSYPQARDELWTVVDAMPGAVYFAGHEHNYSRTQIDPSFSETLGSKKFKFKSTIQQVVVGGFGATLQTEFKSKKGVVVEPRIVYCYAVVDVYSDHIRVRAFDIKDHLLDDFLVESK